MDLFTVTKNEINFKLFKILYNYQIVGVCDIVYKSFRINSKILDSYD